MEASTGWGGFGEGLLGRLQKLLVLGDFFGWKNDEVMIVMMSCFFLEFSGGVEPKACSSAQIEY